jgi:hypothetical protein
MSSGVAYPAPTYIPPLPIFNPLFFPQSFGTTTTSGGGGGGFTNIFPNGLTSGNVITMDGGTGGGGGTGLERTITGISYLDFVDSADTNPTNITGYITLNGNTLEIGSLSNSTGINVNLQGTTVSANGVAIATGGNVSNNINNTFQAPATTQTFNNQNVVMDNSTLSFTNGGVISYTNGSSTLNFPTTFPTTSTGGIGGLGLYWNNVSGNGETDLICYGQLAGGSNISGLNIYNCNNTTAPILVASFNASSSSISTNPTIPTSTTIGTLGSSQTATTYWVNNLYATLASPALTGAPTAPTQSFPNNSTRIATCAFVSNNFAPLASPTFTGTPNSTTPTTGNNSTQIATTAFVNSSITATGFAPINSPIFTGVPQAPTPSTGDASNKIATTTYVQNNLVSYATLLSPTFIGIPTADTATVGTNTNQIATTAFVQSAIGSTITITSGSAITLGSGYLWKFTLSGTTNYGNFFTYRAYTNSTPLTISSGSPTPSPNTYGTLTGNGILVPYSGSTLINTYTISSINNQGMNLQAGPTNPSGARDFDIEIFTTSASFSGTLTMIIKPNQ